MPVKFNPPPRSTSVILCWPVCFPLLFAHRASPEAKPGVRPTLQENTPETACFPTAPVLRFVNWGQARAYHWQHWQGQQRSVRVTTAEHRSRVCIWHSSSLSKVKLSFPFLNPSVVFGGLASPLSCSGSVLPSHSAIALFLVTFFSLHNWDPVFFSRVFNWYQMGC